MSVLAAVLITSGATCQQAAGPSPGSLPPTLDLRSISGSRIAFQDGIPVPAFGRQPRPRLDLADGWRFQPAILSDTLTLTDRRRSLGAIEREAAGRMLETFDDSAWPSTSVPGTFDPPPDHRLVGGWYRIHIRVPGEWAGDEVTLKFARASYIADAWLNSHYLGYHEGGSTPFAFSATKALRVGADNVLALRLESPRWGTRHDIVPWGLTDWWDYGGLTGPVWLEAADPLSIARADVMPRLDGAEVGVVIQNLGVAVRDVRLTVELLPAAVTEANLGDPSVISLIPEGALPIVRAQLDLGTVTGGTVTRSGFRFGLAHPDLWSPARPALYTVHASLTSSTRRLDDLYDTFGLRRITTAGPALLLNGVRTAFKGASLHDEQVAPGRPGNLPSGGPVTSVEAELHVLRQAAAVNLDFIRADHRPANPLLLMLADRLGFAIWEEIPLYHETPQTYRAAMDRGIPQQMLIEMDLRDFNHPSVLFHGLSNESSGTQERVGALDVLRQIDRDVDGSRLVGQAMYGANPRDRTSRDLDLAGFTFYYGVAYGNDAARGTAAALAAAHQTYPDKPLMVLEFGRWSDSPAEDPLQADTFRRTYAALAPVLATESGGYLGAIAWWSLEDYWTDRPGIDVEHFGLFRPDGSRRPVAVLVATSYGSPAGRGLEPSLVSQAAGKTISPGPALPLLLYGLYAVACSAVLLGMVLALLTLTRSGPG